MCLCIKDTDGCVTVLGVYVDDLLIRENSTDGVGRNFDSILSLVIKSLGIEKKFLFLCIILDSEVG